MSPRAFGYAALASWFNLAAHIYVGADGHKLWACVLVCVVLTPIAGALLSG